MAERCADPANTRKLRLIEQLERETKEVLRPAVKDFGWPGVEGAEHVKAGEELGAKLAPVPWAMLMVGLEKELEGFVAQFEQAEALAPPGREALFRSRHRPRARAPRVRRARDRRRSRPTMRSPRSST